MRHLIVNADDFGLTDGINAGIIEAHESGVVTSASLMVRQPAAAAAAGLATTYPSLGVGLHVDLGEWVIVNGDWTAAYQRVDVNDALQVAKEIAEQLDVFVSLLGRLPDHLDSHQNIHLTGIVMQEALSAADKLRIPLRKFDDRVVTCGSFYGQAEDGTPLPEGITLHNLLRLIDEMSSSWNELICHPGHASHLRSSYSLERERELTVLCHPNLTAFLRERQVELESFAGLIG